MSRAWALGIAACGLALAHAAPAKASFIRWSGPRLVDHTAPLSTPSIVHSVACPTATRCLAVGANGTVIESDGADRRLVSGIDGGATLEGITCPSTRLCVIQETGRLLTSTNPTAQTPTWIPVSPRHPPGEQFAGVTCASNTLCIAWGDSKALSVSTDPAGGAARWGQVTLAGPARGAEISGVACAPHTTRCVASMGNTAAGAQFAGTTKAAGGASAWDITSQPGFSAPEKLTCPSTTLCIGITGDEIDTSADPAAGASSWSGAALPTAPSPEFPVAIACPSMALCIAADGDGSVATSTSPEAGAASYTVSAPLDSAGFGTFADTGMACPATTSCLVPDASPGLALITLGTSPTVTVDTDVGGSTAITGLACPAANLCLGVDDGGGILRTTQPGGSPPVWHRSVQAASDGGFNDVSCPTTHFCAAVGNRDRVALSTSPRSSAEWTSFTLPFVFDGGDGPTPYNLERVTCPSSRLCLAAPDEYGLVVTTSPSAGAQSWRLIRPAAGPANLWDSASCATTSFCVAGDLVGRVAVSTAPAQARSWRLSKIASRAGSRPPAITAISCPSTGFCLAGDAKGSVHWSTRPAGGDADWHPARISTSGLIAASCRSRNFCVIIDARHEVYTSVDPTGDKGAWHAVRLPEGHFAIAGATLRDLRSLSCAPRGVCVVGSRDGVIVAGRTRR